MRLNFFSIIIILGISFMTGNVSAMLFGATVGYKNNNLEHISFHSKQCPAIASASDQKRIVLRIDDVQANMWSEVTMKMVADARKEGMRTVLGVIPKDLDIDSEMFSFIRKNQCHVEVAMHGWEHKLNDDYNKPEFGSLSTTEAEKKINMGMKKLKNLTKAEITTFIPPQNILSWGSLIALRQAGFKTISSEGGGKFDYSASTFDWINHKIIPTEEITKSCEKRFAKNQTCIIMLHPQDYATDGKLDPEKYSQYLELLNEFRKQEVSAVTFKEL